MHRIKTLSDAKIYIIGDEDTVVGFLLAGVGDKDGLGRTNYTIVTSKFSKAQIEETFKSYVEREDCGIIIINQHIAEKIRPLLDLHAKHIPTVLEIPSKEQPYDASKDSVMQKIKVFFGENNS
ncbi:vacuolar ATP synthase subunit f, putative [Theileria equi strain WA]|uniref:V-type proton ATPase subunit F n=1 Tax=Theileria equi strain WA TaxID=1537102 RepID=L0AUN0_THEEQ|nr:vacuolar ATP synthase subunit f, putative [Theileria equi strain WA]AFZ79332.1 vacuolar ATP synthase subunit f, putative [Theileria equi strain WA]|eukprot:XP_004828998.1 vacuolar ATP synthase subunit f, putative [Theileria equi strain WA]